MGVLSCTPPTAVTQGKNPGTHWTACVDLRTAVETLPKRKTQYTAEPLTLSSLVVRSLATSYLTQHA